MLDFGDEDGEWEVRRELEGMEEFEWEEEDGVEEDEDEVRLMACTLSAAHITGSRSRIQFSCTHYLKFIALISGFAIFSKISRLIGTLL